MGNSTVLTCTKKVQHIRKQQVGGRARLTPFAHARRRVLLHLERLQPVQQLAPQRVRGQRGQALRPKAWRRGGRMPRCHCRGKSHMSLLLVFVLELAVASVLALAWASVCHAPHISTSASWQPTLPGARAQRLVHKQARRACWHNEAGLEPPRAPAHTWRHRFPSFARLLPIQQTHMYSTDAGGKTAVLMCSPVRRHARLATSHRLLEPGPVSHLTNEHGRGAHPGPTRVRSRARRRC